MSNTNYYYNNLPLPRSQSYSSHSSRSPSNSNYKRSESISAASTLSSLSSSSSSFYSGRGSIPHISMTNQQQFSNTAMMSPAPFSMNGSDYNRPPSSYYSYTTSDYDGGRHQQPQYTQPLPETPSSPSDYYYANNGSMGTTSPRINPYNGRSAIVSPSVSSNLSSRDYNYDTRNTYVNESQERMKPSTSSNAILPSITDSQYPVFPPNQEMILEANSALLATEESFKVIYAGDITYKPEKGLLNKTKKAHFVLTNNHLLIYKNSQKARAEINIFDHDSHHTTATSAAKSIDKDRIFLRLSSIYAVQSTVTAPNTFRIEYFHPHSGQALHHTLTVDSDKECKQWIQALRKAVRVHHPRIESISTSEKYAVIDRLAKQSDTFANTDHIKVYKVVFKEKRIKVGGDVPKEVFLPVILAIGKFSFYFLPISVLDDEYLKTVERDRFGLLSIQSIKFEDFDDTVVIEVKQVSKNNRQIAFASTFGEDIVNHMRRAVDSIVPPALQEAPLLTSTVPSRIRNTSIITYKIPVDPEDEISGNDDEETRHFNTTLRAFTAALNLNKSRFNYTITGPSRSKVLTLLPPNEIGSTPPTYQKYELLAIFRTIQANNIFVEVCFANRTLAELETWKVQAKHGWTVNTTLKDENILANEIFTLLTSLKALRKLDLTNCSIGKPSPDYPNRRHSALSVIGTVMRSGRSSLSRISLGKNNMSERDLSKLIQGIKEHKKSIKELYLNDCGLEKDMVESILKALYEKSPEQVIRLDLSTDIKTGLAIDPELVKQMIPTFKRLETLRMRGYNLVSMHYDFQLENTRLRELDLGGSRMNGDTVARICKWMSTSSFQTIEALHLNDCNLNGRHVYDIFQSISQSGNRNMHLNLEGNPIMKEVMHLPKLHSAIVQGEGPRSISFARIEWDDSTLREFIDCLRDNVTVTHLDLSDISMRDTDEISEDTVRMLTSFFERNTSVTELKLNAEHTRLVGSPFSKSQPKSLICETIIQSLAGLRHNCTLRHIDLSGLNFEDAGALALARVLKTNKTLQSIILDKNNISIEGYRALIKVIEENANQVINIPIPRKDVRQQLLYLAFRIEELIISENEAQFFLIHTTASDKKKIKKHELEMIIQERKNSEYALKNLESVIHLLLVAVRKNMREFEEQSFRNSEFQAQAQNAAQELAIAQVRLQQGRAPSVMSGTNLSAVGVHPRQRNASSSNASTTSSTNSSIRGSLSRSGSSNNNYQNQQMNRRSVLSSEYSGSMSSPVSFLQHNNQMYQGNNDPRMYMSRSNNIEEEMILGKPHSYDGANLQSPITPNMEYPDPYYRHTEYAESSYSYHPTENRIGAMSPRNYGVDDPGFISDFGYIDDYEQSFVIDPGNLNINQLQQLKKSGSVSQDSIYNEDQLVEKFNRGLYLPPDSRD
ncbi:unnamed protein product [Mucor hiemalis]